MGIYESFDEERRAVFNAEDAYHPVKDFPETLIVTFTKKVIEIVRSRFKTELIATIDGEEGLPVYAFECGGKRFGIYRVTMGAAGVVALQEEAAVMGARNFVYFGTCGTLDRTIPAGHLIVPTESYRDEGTSYHYLPYKGSGDDFVKIRTAGRTAEIIREMGLKAVCCRTWTTDALYRETRRNMERMTALGCRAVDMECSAIHAAADFRGINAYQFFFAEDNLDSVEWDPRICGRVPAGVLEFTLDVALEIAEKVEKV